jgi:hypothetical protein
MHALVLHIVDDINTWLEQIGVDLIENSEAYEAALATAGGSDYKIELDPETISVEVTEVGWTISVEFQATGEGDENNFGFSIEGVANFLFKNDEDPVCEVEADAITGDAEDEDDF